MPQQGLQRRLVDRFDPLLVFDIQLLDKGLDEQGNVLTSLPERGEGESKDV